MNYSGIINKSFSIAWKQKTLWIFGLFAGSSGSFNWQDFDEEGFDSNGLQGVIEGLFEGQSVPMEIFTPLLMLGMALGLLLILLHFIAAPALIDGVNKIARGGQYNWSDSFSVGVDNFFRFFGLGVVFAMSILAMIFVYGVIGVVSFVIHVALGILSLLIIIPLFFATLIFMANVFALAERAIVVRKVSIGDGIAEGYYLFRHNVGKNFAIAFINFGLALGLGILQLMIWGAIGLPIGAIVYAMGLGVLPAFAAAFILGLPVSLIVGGFTGTALSNLYTIFYFELLEPSGAEQVEYVPESPSSPTGI